MGKPDKEKNLIEYIKFGYKNDENGTTPILKATMRSNTEIVRILAPLSKRPNAPNCLGETPILHAARSGLEEIVRILVPLSENPTESDINFDSDSASINRKTNSTPLLAAAGQGDVEIVRILAPLLKDPNAPNKYGCTPIYQAASYGHLEVVRILAPLTSNPNALSTNYKNEVETPIIAAAIKGHSGIVLCGHDL